MARHTLIPAAVAGAILVGAFAPGTAHAWKHTGHFWPYETHPVPYWIVERPLDGLPGDGYLTDVMVGGYADWSNTAECADFRAQHIESFNTEDDPDLESYGASPADGENWVVFDDPGNRIAEPGTLAITATISRPGGPFIQGKRYRVATDSDIIFNDGHRWISDEDIEAGNCTGQTSIQAVATHEIGHLIGLDHSCEREDICLDPVLRNATMYWSAGPCTPNTVNRDDIESINALYGPNASFACSHELTPGSPNTIAFGNVPMELKCALRSDNPEEVVAATWNWGDGTVTNDINGTHTYEEAGNYTIRVCFEGERDTCGAWEYCFRRDAYVRVCDVPEPAFSYEPTGGLSYKFLNETDIRVYGCIFDIQWDIYEGDSATGEPIATRAAWEPEYTFDSPGTYTAVMHLGGPAGTGAAELTFRVKRVYEARCDALGGAGAAGFGLIALIGAAIRRRQD